MNYLLEHDSSDLIIATNITRNYVPDWTVLDAMRELLQNAIDSDPHCYSIDFLESVDGETSCVIDTNTSIPLEAFYMGESGKRNASGMLGVHGEGLKLALLVLTRENREPEIFSEHYIHTYFKPTTQGIDVEVLELALVPNTQHDLANPKTRIEFDCTREEWQQFGSMHLKNRAVGFVLGAGKLYVGGLFITDTELHHSYNLSPEDVKLERDRRVADYTDMMIAIAKLWKDSAKWDEIALGMLQEVEDFNGFSYIDPPPELVEAVVRLADKMDKPPVTWSMAYSGTYYGSQVPNTFYNTYSRSPNARKAQRKANPEQLLKEWFKLNRSYFRKAGAKRFQELLTLAKKWNN